MLSPIWLRACLLFLAGCALCAPALAVGDADQARPKVLPVPKQLEPQPGYCTLAEGIALDVADPVLLEHARVFAEELRFLHGVDVVLGAEASAEERAGRVPLTLALREAATLGEDDPAAVVGERIDESYTLAVDPAAIRVEAATPTGIAWGTATLLQWIQVRSGLGPGAVCVRVADAPLAPYRAVLIDVARAPHSIEVLRGVVRAARLLKLRFVHLHLTDDQSFTLPFEPVTSQLTGNRAYTPAELRELVEYARVRGVVLIPEIDLPGHSGKLLQSGFLEGAQSHADVASEEHWEGVRAVIDAGIDAFPTSPYFHIGGDESGAGSALVPFLERVNAHVRSRGKRLLLWEGFHGAPLEAIPATGPDRVIVAAWESSYNAPWDLLDAGYTLVNASWKPLYVVGGHSRLHPGVSAGRKWQPEAIAHWH
ncbi:MAG: family 20 glycosylhydrolase, partial [Planctomycetota bacterium]